MRLRSRASTAALARSRRYLLSTRSMNAERECFDPAKRSTLSRTSFESVIEVFSFILPSYYHMANFGSACSRALEREHQFARVAGVAHRARGARSWRPARPL